MTETIFDDFGPAKVVQLYSVKERLRAFVAIDNTALGPGIGGVRMSLTVTPEEICRLARTMTLKNSIAGLPYGGAKAGIVADPNDPCKERIFRGGVRPGCGVRFAGGVHDPAVIDIEQLIEVKKQTGSVVNYGKGTRLLVPEIFAVPCDVLIPAAAPDVIHGGNAGLIGARMIVQGANIPATAQAEEQLNARGVLVVPDFIANAGGVIMAAMEYAGKSQAEAFDAIGERIRKNTKLVLEKMAKERILPRAAAETLARERIAKAMSYRDY